MIRSAIRFTFRSWWLGLLAALAFAAPALADRNDIVVRDDSSSYTLDGAHQLKLDVPVGEVHVEPASGDQIQVRLKLECEHETGACRNRADKTRIEISRHGDDLVLS